MSDAAPLEPGQLAAYFALMEVGSLLQHAVEQQLREEGGLSYIQFQILAVLGETADGRQRMTDLADRLVHSRSGLTYQAGQLAEAGLIAKGPSPDDERSVIASLTPAGRALLGRGRRQARRRPRPCASAHALCSAPLRGSPSKARLGGRTGGQRGGPTMTLPYLAESAGSGLTA